MKFSEMPYSRPDMEALAAATTQTLEAMKAAPNAAGQIAAYDAYEKKMQTAGTMQQIAYIRHTINTKDEFYNAENDYMDEIGPKLQELDPPGQYGAARIPLPGGAGKALWRPDV